MSAPTSRLETPYWLYLSHFRFSIWGLDHPSEAPNTPPAIWSLAAKLYDDLSDATLWAWYLICRHLDVNLGVFFYIVISISIMGVVKCVVQGRFFFLFCLARSF